MLNAFLTAIRTSALKPQYRRLSLRSSRSPASKATSKPTRRSSPKPDMAGGNGSKPLGSKSTLGENHRFPAFYACYLLKSVKTSKSTATYIGSTPHPPRRIRQHNGFLSAGAWKTARNRPWEMQMIVHGFASKLAALQFEWAWQHPHLSRFLRGVEGAGATGRSRSVRLGANVSVVQTMLRTHPYTTWPLHVKLFTRGAVESWMSALALHAAGPNAASKPRKRSKKLTNIPSSAELTEGLPQGTVVTVELEGVDGSGTDETLSDRTRRKGAIEVTDETFTSAHLAKLTRTLASKPIHPCNICKEPVNLATSDPLATSLCPIPHCTGVAHLTCLSRHFLDNTDHSISEVIPRGGTCPSCSEYILWGTVIKGCYRRRSGGRSNDPEDEEEEDIKDDNVVEDNAESPSRPAVAPRKAVRTPNAVGVRKRGRPKGKGNTKQVESGSEQEIFDLDAISSGTDSEEELELPSRPTLAPKPSKVRSKKTRPGMPP